MTTAATNPDDASALAELVAPGERTLLGGGRILAVFDGEHEPPTAVVLLPSCVARWRGPALLGLAVTASTAFLWPSTLFTAAPLWLPIFLLGLTSVLVARGAQLFGLFAAPIRVCTPVGDRCRLEIRQRPEWRVVAFRFSVRDAARRRLGRVENVFGYWSAAGPDGAERFAADDQELRWRDAWRRMLHRGGARSAALTFTSSTGAVLATTRAGGVTFGPDTGALPDDDRSLLFAACVIAELVITHRL